MAIYHHYLHDYYKLSEKLKIHWAQNSTWQQVKNLVQHHKLPSTDALIYEGSLCVRYLSGGALQRIEPLQLVLPGLQEGRPGIKHQGAPTLPYARLPAS
jgi:hypothetical protein